MKKILVIGGTRFFGKRLVEKLLQQQHELTLITRGVLPEEFQGKVQHLQCDRTDKNALETAIGDREFDVVYDNVNFTPQDAKEAIEIFKGKTSRYIFTSTLSVHEADGIPKIEKDFDPKTYSIFLGERTEFTYAEGKRQAEAVFFQQASFPVVAVRFPIVMGEDDYTKRLLFHTERIKNQQAISFMNIDANMGYISSEEAAEFLVWSGMESFEGPIHAAANGLISNKELIQLIEEISGQQAIIALAGAEETKSPYSIPKSWYMKTNYAQKLGFKFSDLHNWLPQLIKNIL